MPIAITSTLSNGNVVDAPQLNANFLDLAEPLNGTENMDVIIKHNHATLPPLKLNQLGDGPIAILQQNSVDKLVIENNGKITNDNVIVVTKSWLYVVLPAAVESVESQPRFIVPSIGLNTITKLYVVWAAGSDSGASNVFTIKRRNAAGALQSDVGTVEVNTPAQNAIGTSDVADVPLTAGDQIYPLFTTRNTASEQMVTVSIEITIKLS